MQLLSENELIAQLKQRFEEKQKALEELKEITEELRNVNKKLAESEALKSHFISNITNEIVNPFSSILGLSRNILALKEDNIQRAKPMAELIYSEAFDLDFQLKNIFAAAKLEAGEAFPEFQNVDVDQLISSVVETYRYKADQKQLSIHFNFNLSPELKEKCYFRTDAEKLKLIVSNLMSNGIKYSNAANNVEVTAWIQDGFLKVMVKDYGIGIDSKDLQTIFDRFKRINNTINSLNPGHGLGLSVVKSMLDLLNGTIEIVSRKNQGSVFTVSFPEGPKEDTEGLATDGNEFLFDDQQVF